MGHLPKQASVWRLKAPALALDLTALKVGPAGAAFPPFVLAWVSPDTAPTPKARLSPVSQSACRALLVATPVRLRHCGRVLGAIRATRRAPLLQMRSAEPSVALRRIESRHFAVRRRLP